LGLEVLEPLWRHTASVSAATRSRWQWTWVGDDSVFKKYGEQLGLVGTWWSGQEHRGLYGIDGILLVVVIGDGKLVVPVDFAIRRPDPTGPGRPCQDKLRWVQGMLDGHLAAWRRRGVELPPPMVVADSWFGDSKLIRHVATTHEGTLLGGGKTTYVFELAEGRQVKGHDLQKPGDWPWRQSLQVPGVHYARLRATSPTYGAATVNKNSVGFLFELTDLQSTITLCYHHPHMCLGGFFGGTGCKNQPKSATSCKIPKP
jgi:DDE superfamily endonuclease